MPASSGRRRRPGGQAEAKPAGNLEDLRRLVLGPERQRLERLEQQIPTSAEALSVVLPEAVSRATQSRREELGIAVEPSVAAAVRSVARHEPDLFGEILSPTIGAAVRKAVSDAIAALIQRFDRALDESLSLRSVRWRVEARRTGQPFAEVVLRHTLVYQVEQVLLIHPGSGLLLQHVVAEGVGAKDPDQVAAMLEAIDAFVHDAFAPEPSSVHLSNVQVGDLMVWVDRDASLAVAAVVRGVAPREFYDSLRQVRERIYLGHQLALDRFESNVAEFATTRPILERLLLSQRSRPPRRAPIWLGASALVLAALLGSTWARARAHAEEQTRRLEASVAALEAEPGIAVTSAERRDGRIRIAGFRDVLAARPDELLARAGLPQADLKFERFYSLDAAIVERRVRRVLQPPATVTLAISDTTLRATGAAPRSYIDRARSIAPALPGVERYDDSALRAQEAIAALRRAATALGATEVPFARGSYVAASPAAMEQAQSHARQVTRAATDAGLDACIAVVGYTDPIGNEAENLRLSALRAQHVADTLTAQGIRAEALHAAGAGIHPRATTPARARTVAFEVAIGQICAGAP